jgi:hypothetical protein
VFSSGNLILLKSPLGKKILNFGGIKSPRLYRKNPSTGILERRFLPPDYHFFTTLEKVGFFSRIETLDATLMKP